VESLSRFVEAIGSGPQLFIKRDDETGLATGGNKARKLEFLLADALEKQADVVITTGRPNSNHTRMTAAAARKLSLDCLLVVSGDEPAEICFLMNCWARIFGFVPLQSPFPNFGLKSFRNYRSRGELLM